MVMPDELSHLGDHGFDRIKRAGPVDLGYSEAEPLYQEGLAIRKQLLGETHPDVATSLNNLALLYFNQDLVENAMLLVEQALNMIGQLLGNDHPSTQTLRKNLDIVKASMREN